jgi:hypothetical protein
MDTYISWVSGNPILSAAIQFGILGTIGELISYYIRSKSLSGFGNVSQVILKILGWALLGIIIKYGFAGMKGFTDALLTNGLLPQLLNSGVIYAFTLSVLTNIFFGPQMMAFHRFTDNLISGHKGFKGIEKAWFTLIWFWIPAHTITFSLPKDYQIGLAALCSLALGIILGLANTGKYTNTKKS